MTTVGVGLVGYGFGNQAFHGPLIRETDGLEVRAVMTANPERRQLALEHFPGVKIYEKYDELLADPRIDLVVISTPHSTHAPLTIQACEKGKHVVVDKIMALGVAEGEAMIKAAERAGVLLSVFHNRRWDCDYLTVKNALQKGLLGEPWVIESSVVNFRTPPPPGQPLPWRMQARYGGGIIRDWGAHLLDQAIQLLGNDIRSVYADFQYRWPRIDVESAAVCWIRFNDGVRFRVEVGGISKIGRPRWYVRGSRGALVIDSLDPQEAELKRQVVISGTEQARIPGEKCRFESDVPGAELEILPGDYLAYYKNIAAALLEGAPLEVTPESVLDSLRLLEAIVASAASGTVINYP
jgi:scyllo-inositol 2-dehydrogenase (NADP+)